MSNQSLVVRTVIILYRDKRKSTILQSEFIWAFLPLSNNGLIWSKMKEDARFSQHLYPLAVGMAPTLTPAPFMVEVGGQ